MASGVIFVSYHDINGRPYINVYDTDGELIRTLDITYVDDWCFYSMCIDGSGNIFFQGYDIAASENKLYKIDSLGNVLISITCPESYTYCELTMGADGYVYTSNDMNPYKLYKRDSTTLEEVAYQDKPVAKDFDGLAFYSNTGYIMANYTDEYVERWDFVDGYIDRMSMSAADINNLDLAISGEMLLGFHRNQDAWTCPTDLSEAKTDWAIDGIPRMIAVGVLNDEDFLFGGEVVNNGEQYMARYTPAKVLVWKKEILAEENYIVKIRAYPFVPVAVYDYPLAPVIFPAQSRRTTLREDCINFEESMSDVCLVVNHNSRVTREYLQLTYDGAGFGESSNLRFILPSQQLVKLSNKDLTTEDYDAIINNFITNISSMFTLINENNTLIKTWLHDYEPEEDEHDFTDVKMRPITIGKDLSKTMNELFEGIIDNVTILNMNLELLKERF